MCWSKFIYTVFGAPNSTTLSRERKKKKEGKFSLYVGPVLVLSKLEYWSIVFISCRLCSIVLLWSGSHASLGLNNFATISNLSLQAHTHAVLGPSENSATLQEFKVLITIPCMERLTTIKECSEKLKQRRFSSTMTYCNVCLHSYPQWLSMYGKTFLFWIGTPRLALTTRLD